MPYIDGVEIEYDSRKESRNLAKHRVSLEFGLAILTNPVSIVTDERRDYGEERYNAFGYVAGRLFACTFTMRGAVYRIISVRKASRQEQRKWQSFE